MPVGRYLVVNPADHTIVGGPYMWDPEDEWTPPEVVANPDAGYEVLEESAAMEDGYEWPPAPPSEDPGPSPEPDPGPSPE
jgi:hypothetical protein